MDSKVKSWLNILFFLFLVIIMAFLIMFNGENTEKLLILSSVLITSISIRYLLLYEKIRLYRLGFAGIVLDGVLLCFMSLLDRHGIIEIYYLVMSAEVLAFYPALFSLILVIVSYCTYITVVFFSNRFAELNDLIFYSARSLLTLTFIVIVMLIVKYLLNENTKLNRTMSSMSSKMNSNEESVASIEVTVKNSLTLGVFTKRELDIASLIASGYSNREIADALYLTEGTVKNYISAIYEKLGTNERVKAVEQLKTILIK